MTSVAGNGQSGWVCTEVMRALPYGLPKIMVSTVASGDTRVGRIGGDAREQRLERERSRRRMQRPSLQLRKVEKLPKQSFERLD